MRNLLVKLSKSFGIPNKEQWFKVLKAVLYSFISALLAVIIAAGGIQNNAEANIALILAGMTAGANAVLYTLYITFFEEAKK